MVPGMLTATDYRPPRWLRNAHVQSVLGSSPLRRRYGERSLAEVGAVSTEHLIDAGEGVRLHGLHSVMPDRDSRGLVLLLHGWEGSVDSSYMRLTAVQLLRAGFEVFRLNFRDHGNTHHLNEGLFHSNRIDEVVHAAREVSRRFPNRPMAVAGYSLGGNFALRLALRAPARGPGAGTRGGGLPGAGPGPDHGVDGARACRCTCGTSSASGAARWRASASCSRRPMPSTTKCSACACAR